MSVTWIKISQGQIESLDDDFFMEQILESLQTQTQRKVFSNIASLSRSRKKKVLCIRRQLTGGTYDVTNRLDETIDQIIEAMIR